MTTIESIDAQIAILQAERDDLAKLEPPEAEIVASALATMSDRSVSIDYTNWRGYRAMRHIIPLSITWEKNPWHPEREWMLRAVDVEKQAIRTFALSNIHEWGE